MSPPRVRLSHVAEGNAGLRGALDPHALGLRVRQQRLPSGGAAKSRTTEAAKGRGHVDGFVAIHPERAHPYRRRDAMGAPDIVRPYCTGKAEWRGVGDGDSLFLSCEGENCKNWPKHFLGP